MDETLMMKYFEGKANSLTVKEMDPDQQPREKAEKFGCSVLSVPELWALILRTGTQGNPVTELCREFMRANDGSLHRLERRTRRELRDIKGIGTTKSIQIEAVLELIKRYCEEEFPMDESIRDSMQVFKRMRHKIGNLDHEEIWILLVNRGNQVIKEVPLTSGTGTASIFDVKTAIKHALLENAEGLILCHNHPSGNNVPSQQDDAITRNLKKACDLMNLKMLDHLIITANNHYSYNDNGKL